MKPKQMKRLLLTVILLAAISGVFALYALAENEGNTLNADTGAAEEPEKRKKLFLQVGALESKDGDKYLLRKRSSHVEFYIDEQAKIFIKQDGKIEDIKEGSYIVVKGPRNENIILANSIYIYDSKEEYDEFSYTGWTVDEDDIKREQASSLTGIVKNPEDRFDKIDENKRPLLLESDLYKDENGNPREYFVSFDKDTYMIYSKSCSKDELGIGDRLQLYFDKRISIRYKSYPVKIIINRAKVGY